MKEISGDLIELFQKGKFSCIAHGCNAFCTMNSGIARQIRSVYPDVYTADMLHSPPGDISKMGDFSLEWVERSDIVDGVVYNAYTQFQYGGPERNAEYSAIISSLKGIVEHMGAHGYFSLGIPKIGCGLGGAEESIVKDIVKFVEYDNKDVEITWVNYQKK